MGKYTMCRLRYRQKNVAAGKCQFCPKPLGPTHKSRCVFHLAATRKSSRKSYEKKKGVLRATYAARVAAGLCGKCKNSTPALPGRSRCEYHRAQNLASVRKSKGYGRRSKTIPVPRAVITLVVSGLVVTPQTCPCGNRPMTGGDRCWVCDQDARVGFVERRAARGGG